MQGTVHIIDAVLRPPNDELQKKTVRHALWGLEAKAPIVSAHKSGRSCREAQNVWRHHGAKDNVRRDSAVHSGRGRIASKVRPGWVALPPAYGFTPTRRRKVHSCPFSAESKAHYPVLSRSALLK